MSNEKDIYIIKAELVDDLRQALRKIDLAVLTGEELIPLTPEEYKAFKSAMPITVPISNITNSNSKQMYSLFQRRLSEMTEYLTLRHMDDTNVVAGLTSLANELLELVRTDIPLKDRYTVEAVKIKEE